jgi:hypothetical protein
MFDFVKLGFNSSEVAQRLVNDPIFCFTAKVCISTSEILKYEGFYNSLKFTIYPSNRIIIEGSLHIFYNSIIHKSKHNYNQFSYSMLEMAIKKLTGIVKIEAKHMVIHNLEFGHNLQLNKDVDVRRKLDNFVCFKFQHPFCKDFYLNKGYMIQYLSTQACIKLYDKGGQYNLPYNLLRVEKRIKKMQNQFKKTIFLSDLLSEAFWIECQNALVKAFEKCLYIEIIKKVKLSSCEEEFLVNAQKPSFWESLTARNRCYYSKKRLPLLLTKFELNTFKQSLFCMMEQLFNQNITA